MFRTGYIVSSVMIAGMALFSQAVSATSLGDATQTLCADGQNKLCATLPTDMNNALPSLGYIPDTTAGGTGSFNQTYVDFFGWQSFVALNWPVDGNGLPSLGRTIVNDTTSPRVWSTFKTPEDVFSAPAVSAALQECETPPPGTLRLYRTSKMELSSFKEAFTPYPLIDRNGNFVLYDRRLNDVEVDFLAQNGLRTKAGQAMAKAASGGEPYDFPTGVKSQYGSIEIKTAWRILSNPEEAKDFYTTRAQVVVPASSTHDEKGLCIDATVGFVGIHIMQKFSNPTTFANLWAWASFEHVKNAPTAKNAPISPINSALADKSLSPPPSCEPVHNILDPTTYSFFNQTCAVSAGGGCPINEPPLIPPGGNGYKWSSKEPYADKYMTKGLLGRKFGTQVARCFDIYPSAKAVTAKFSALLGNSVWKNYMLIGVQWGAAGNTGGVPFNKLMPTPAPIYLTNTTLETYLQLEPIVVGEKNNPKAGSCITCHSQAQDTAGRNSNFSFLPGFAQ